MRADSAIDFAQDSMGLAVLKGTTETSERSAMVTAFNDKAPSPDMPVFLFGKVGGMGIL